MSEGQLGWLTPCARIDPRFCALRADVSDKNYRTHFGVTRGYVRHQRTIIWRVYTHLYEALQLAEFLSIIYVIEAFNFWVDGSTDSRYSVQQMAQQSDAIRGVNW